MNKLNKIRANIEDIDNSILKLLKKRFVLVHKIGEIKNNSNATIKDKERERHIIKRLIEKNKNVNKEFICKLYKIIFKYSRNLQKKAK
jgi:chorismate mutase